MTITIEDATATTEYKGPGKELNEGEALVRRIQREVRGTTRPGDGVDVDEAILAELEGALDVIEHERGIDVHFTILDQVERFVAWQDRMESIIPN